MLSVEAQRPGGPLPVPYIPDDLTLAQFFLDAHHSIRTQRSSDIPWFIDDVTGRKLGLEEVLLSVMVINSVMMTLLLDSYTNLGSCQYAQGQVWYS